MRDVVVTVVLATLHFVASVILLVGEFATVAAVWDSGRAPTLGERLWHWAAGLVLSPVYLGVVSLLPRSSVLWGAWEYAVVFANSLVWAVGLAWLLRRARSRRHR